MEDPLYRDIILNEYYSPKHHGLMDEFTNEAKASNMMCGDTIVVRLRMRDSVLEDVSFKHIGCVISKVSASFLLGYIRGKRKEEVLSYDKTVPLSLMNIPITPAREKCATLILEAIQRAL